MQKFPIWRKFGFCDKGRNVLGQSDWRILNQIYDHNKVINSELFCMLIPEIKS